MFRCAALRRVAATFTATSHGSTLEIRHPWMSQTREYHPIPLQCSRFSSMLHPSPYKRLRCSPLRQASWVLMTVSRSNSTAVQLDPSPSTAASASTAGAGRALTPMRLFAVCTAEEYDLKRVATTFGTDIQGAASATLPHYLHVRNPITPSRSQPLDVFFFPFGAFVAWGASRDDISQLVDIMRWLQRDKERDQPAQAAISHSASERLEHRLREPEEVEDYAWGLGDANVIDTQNDVIVLRKDDIKTKLSFSFGLAGSAKLTVVEDVIDRQVDELVRRASKALRKDSLLRHWSILLMVKKNNLRVIELPDYFWENPQQENLLNMCKAYCGTATRVKILDEKVEYVKGIITTHRDNLNHQHSLRLERIIAGLICIEIFFHLLDHNFYRDDIIAAINRRFKTSFGTAAASSERASSGTTGHQPSTRSAPAVTLGSPQTAAVSNSLDGAAAPSVGVNTSPSEANTKRDVMAAQTMPLLLASAPGSASGSTTASSDRPVSATSGVRQDRR